jgi:hypothetical protein
MWFSCFTGAKKHHFTSFVKEFFALKNSPSQGLSAGRTVVN